MLRNLKKTSIAALFADKVDFGMKKVIRDRK